LFVFGGEEVGIVIYAGYIKIEMYFIYFIIIILVQLHSFPEGKVSQERAPIRRLKWGTASLIVRSPVTPIILPIVHSGFEKVF
jgi:hypothetical protein